MRGRIIHRGDAEARRGQLSPELVNAKWFVIGHGEGFDSLVCDGKDLLMAISRVVFDGTEEGMAEHRENYIEDLNNEDNWSVDTECGGGRYHYHEDIGETAQLDIWRLAEMPSERLDGKVRREIK